MSDAGEQSKQTDREKEGNDPRTTAEWVSLVVSLLLLAMLVGVICVLWRQDSGKPASFRIEKGPVQRAGSRYHLPFTIRNEGDRTAANVTVEGKVAAVRSGSDDETAATTFDFVPAHARAEGVLVFTEEPSEANVRVTSFQPP